MLKHCLIILVLIISSSGYAQDEDAYVFGDNTASTSSSSSSGSGFDWDKVTIGGSVGLTFGSITFVEIAPTFGYFLTDNILAGVGANYTYYEEKAINFNTTLYGARAFGEYLFNDLPFLAHTEVEMINLQWTQEERKNIVNFYVGGGLKQLIGGNSYFYILVLWNLNETRETIIIQQPNPIIRGGVAIGL